jgi:acyl-CoA thioester hydrolase
VEGVFRRLRTVRAEDLDRLGHVNNVVWVRFVVELAFAHSAALGWDLGDYERLGAWWIVRRHEIDYLAPALPGEEIEERTAVVSMRGARSLRRSAFLRPGDGTLLVSARTEWAFVDAATQRPRRIDPAVLASFPVVAEEAFATPGP